jgi:putative peptide zinc metalloprotease protein
MKVRGWRVVLVLLLALSLGFAAPGVAHAQDNAAVAINTKDGSDVIRLAFNIHRTMSDTVDSGNAAVAFASCTDCTTIAVAIQVVFIMSDASVIAPENVAIAINQECTACNTFASAYQFVITTDGPVHFTAEGYKLLADLKKRIRDLLEAGLPLDQLDAQLDALMDELAAILRDHLVSAGGDGNDDIEEEEDVDVETSPTSTDAEPSPVATPEPTPEETITPSPTPEPSPSS